MQSAENHLPSFLCSVPGSTSRSPFIIRLLQLWDGVRASYRQGDSSRSGSYQQHGGIWILFPRRHSRVQRNAWWDWIWYTVNFNWRFQKAAKKDGKWQWKRQVGHYFVLGMLLSFSTRRDIGIMQCKDFILCKEMQHLATNTHFQPTLYWKWI